MESKKIFCTRCGSQNLQTIIQNETQTQGKDFSASKGCLGYLMFGPLGVLCGSCGQNKKTVTTNTSLFSCNDCGHQFRKRENIEKDIEENRKNIKVGIATGLIFAIIVFIGTIACEAPIYVCVSASAIALAIGSLVALPYKNKVSKANAELEEYDRQQKHFSELN